MIKNAENFYQCVAVCETVLAGKTCFTSRRKDLSRNTLLDPQAGLSFGTLHCIADKILKVTDSDSYLDMWEIIEEALEKECELPENKPARDGIIRQFYLTIREIENGLPFPNFSNPKVQSLFRKVVDNYNNLKGKDKKDWEDSFVAATNALRLGIDYQIKATNLVLVNIEYLKEKSNVNALDFFLTLFRHQSVRGCNCYFMNKDLQLYLYSEKDDLFYPVVDTDYLHPVAFHVP